MDLQITNQHRAQVEDFLQKHRTVLLNLLFTDIVGSTKIKHELGDQKGVQLIQQHHSIVREILADFPEGEEIDTAGDSFFIVFVKPSDAVKFSLLLQSRLRNNLKETPLPLLDRIGIHLGEVFVEERDDIPKSKDFFGMQVDTAARVMSTANGNQIVMTRSVFDNARQVLKGQELAGIGELSWVNHGPYVLKGIEEPLEICEVGEEGIAPLSPPADSESVYRHISPDSEPVLGWRPALGLTVPGTEWILEEKLGEGGFGEVWKAQHRKLKENRVFKFCFRADRVRSLKREVTLFRVLKERVGEHPNIVRLHDVFFDEPPYYIVTEYVEGRDLISWCERNGGINNIPLETRLEIIAQAAEALQAAHDAGIIHRDLKPSNILIDGDGTSPEKIKVKLTDFGIGQVVSDQVMAGMTQFGFTQTILADDHSSHSGTHLYMAPELFAGKPASIRSDIYSLGVVLYQMYVGDLSRPLSTEWVKHIEDPLIKDDLTNCFYEYPQDRFPAVGQLAQRLHTLNIRRKERADQEAAKLRALRRRRLTMVTSILLGIITLLTIALGYGLWREKIQRQIAEREQYYSNIGFAGECIKNLRFERARELLLTCPPQFKNWEWGRYQLLCNQDLFTLSHHSNPVSSLAISPNGQYIVTGTSDGTAKVWNAENAQEIMRFNKHSDDEYVTSVAFSPDGKFIISAGGNDVYICSVATGQVVLNLTGDFSTMTIRPDGKHIAVVNMTSNVETEGFMAGQTLYHAENTAIIYEMGTGQEIFKLDEHIKPITSLAYSPDGKYLLTGSKDSTAKVWNTDTGQAIHSLEGHTNQVVFAAFSPDGKRIVTGSNDNTAKIWNTETGQEITSLDGHYGPVIYAAFSPNGKLIATGSFDNTAKIWNSGTGQEIFSLEGNTNPVGFLEFNKNGKRLISITGIGEGSAKLWDVETGQEIRDFKITGHHMDITCASFNSNGELIVTGGFDKTAKIWDAKTGNELLNLEGHSALIRYAAFTPDSKRLVTASNDGTAKIWNIENIQAKNILADYPASDQDVALSPTGEHIVSVGDDNTAIVWNAETGYEVHRLEGHIDKVTTVGFSPNGSRIVTASLDKTAKVWNTKTGKEILNLKIDASSVYSPVFSPDGNMIAINTGREDSQIIPIIDSKTGKEISSIKGISELINSMLFSPDGKRLVTTNSGGLNQISDDIPDTLIDEKVDSQLLTEQEMTNLIDSQGMGISEDEFIEKEIDGDFDAEQELNSLSNPLEKGIPEDDIVDAIKIWDIETGQVITSHEIKSSSESSASIMSIAFSPDGKRIVTGHDNNIATLWNAETAQESLTFNKHASMLTSESFSPDGKRILLGGLDHTVKVFDTETASELLSLEGHSGMIFSMSFSPEGKQIATTSEDKTVKLWDAETGQEITTLAGHSENVVSVVFSPGGKRLATRSGFEDVEIQIWNVSTGQEIHTIKNTTGVIHTMFFSSDGKSIVTASPGKSVQVWRDDESFIEITGIELTVWDTETGKEIKRLGGPPDVILSLAVSPVAVSPDGKRVFTGCRNNTVKVWDAQTFYEITSLEGHTAPVLSLEFSPDGKKLATVSMDKTIKVWNTETNQEITSFKGHSTNIISTVFSPDGKRIATESEDNVIKVWNANTGQEIKTLEGGSGSNISMGFIPNSKSMAFTSDGKRLITVIYGETFQLNSPFEESSDEVTVWDTETGQEITKLNDISGMIFSIVFSPDGKRIITENAEGSFQVRDIETGQIILEKPSGIELFPFSSEIFDPRGSHIITTSWEDNCAKVWNLKTGQEVLTLEGNSPVAYSPDGKKIITCGYNRTAKVWDANTGKRLITLKGHSAAVNAVAFSPDGQRIVTACGIGDGTIYVWDAETGREIITLEGRPNSVKSLSFSPEGKRIIVEYDNGAPIVWNAFPWQEKDYPGDSSLPFEERIELYKRDYWQ